MRFMQLYGSMRRAGYKKNRVDICLCAKYTNERTTILIMCYVDGLLVGSPQRLRENIFVASRAPTKRAHRILRPFDLVGNSWTGFLTPYDWGISKDSEFPTCLNKSLNFAAPRNAR